MYLESIGLINDANLNRLTWFTRVLQRRPFKYGEEHLKPFFREVKRKRAKWLINWEETKYNPSYQLCWYGNLRLWSLQRQLYMCAIRRPSSVSWFNFVNQMLGMNFGMHCESSIRDATLFLFFSVFVWTGQNHSNTLRRRGKQISRYLWKGLLQEHNPFTTQIPAFDPFRNFVGKITFWDSGRLKIHNCVMLEKLKKNCVFGKLSTYGCYKIGLPRLAHVWGKSLHSTRYPWCPWKFPWPGFENVCTCSKYASKPNFFIYIQIMSTIPKRVTLSKGKVIFANHYFFCCLGEHHLPIVGVLDYWPD